MLVSGCMQSIIRMKKKYFLRMVVRASPKDYVLGLIYLDLGAVSDTI
jgi:hypothetical protein